MSEAAVFSTTKRCPECGKQFTVLWPHQWAYKRFWPSHPVYWCSWKCLRANDKKEGEKHVGKPRKITKEQEMEAARIAIETGDPREYLRGLGFDNPAQKWYEIKSRIKDQDPDLYAKLPRVCGKKSKPVKAEPTLADAVQGMTEAAETFFGEFEKMGLTVDKPDVTEKPKICKPVNYDGFEMITIRSTETGNKFEWSAEYKLFTIKSHGDEMTLYIDDFKALLEEIPRAAAALGVEL